MKKYTLSKLINSLIEFEETLSKYLDEKGFTDMARDSRQRLDTLRDSSNVIIVEMTLEPIYTVDITEVLNLIRNANDRNRIKELVRNMYIEISKALENISLEYAELMKSFF